MSQCPPFQKVVPGVCTWSVYSKECKTDCFAHAHIYRDNLILIDPILPSSIDIWNNIVAKRKPSLIILTNGNHERHTIKFVKEYKLPVAASIDALPEMTIKPEIILESQPVLQGLRPIACPGGSPGETALFSEATNTLILGDSIINLPDTGLQLLPDKYCSDPKQLKKSLALLLNLPFEQVLMSHGIPLTENPKKKLRQLLKY